MGRGSDPLCQNSAKHPVETGSGAVLFYTLFLLSALSLDLSCTKPMFPLSFQFGCQLPIGVIIFMGDISQLLSTVTTNSHE